MSWFFSDPLPVGSAAPDFTATDDQGRAVSLSALQGANVVLIFYPGDDTTICRQQLCEFRDSWAQVTARNVLVFGVNPASAESHHKFREKSALPFPLLVDQSHKIAKAFHAGGLIVRRTVYLIDPNGTIRFAQRGKPTVESVLATAT